MHLKREAFTSPHINQSQTLLLLLSPDLVLSPSLLCSLSLPLSFCLSFSLSGSPWDSWFLSLSLSLCLSLSWRLSLSFSLLRALSLSLSRSGSWLLSLERPSCSLRWCLSERSLPLWCSFSRLLSWSLWWAGSFCSPLSLCAVFLFFSWNKCRNSDKC